MSKFSAEERQRMYDEARAALEGAERTLEAPRPQLVEPPIEDKLTKWRRQAREQEEQFARERAAPRMLTEWEAAQLQRAELAGMIAEQKDFTLRLLAELIAEERAAFAERLDKLAGEIELLRQAVAKPSGEIIDLPNPLARRVA